jgi:LCP family protein required for cell wall assembly
MKTTLKRGTGRGSSNGSNGHATVPPRSPLTPIARYGGPPRRSWPRRIGKTLLWLVVVVLMSVGALVGGFWLWINESVSAVRAHTKEAIEAEKVLDVPLPGQPTVAMVLGYDKRYGEGKGVKSRSDTIMLIRLDPQGKTVSMLSFPRDLNVEIHCRGRTTYTARINEAFSQCGQRGSLETVKALTGIKINYLITVNFRGFQQIVNKLGGVYIDVDQRYFNNNAGLYGLARFAKINLHPGYQKLYGPTALDFVRYRHTDSDLYRNARQQEFVKAMKQQVSSFSNITKIPSIVSSITENVEVGVGGGKALDKRTLLGYAKLAYELPTGSFQQARLQGLSDIAGTYELQASDEAVQTAVDDFMKPDTDAAAKATQVATRKKTKKEEPVGPSPADVTIRVLNGNGTAGSADDAAYLLGRRGYGVTVGGNADRFDYFETVVIYDPASPDAKLAAEAVAKLFDGKTEEAAPDSTIPEMLLVTVGQTFHGTLAPAPRDTTPKYSPPDVEPEAEARPLVRRAQQKSDFQLLAPTVKEQGSSLGSDEPIRVYELNDHTAVRLTYRSAGLNEYWGIQQTSWMDAPMLDEPSVRRRIAGRSYRLFFSGPRLHVVAFEENGAAYWVVNSLLDGLSNETMLAIAKGLKPVRG